MGTRVTWPRQMVLLLGRNCILGRWHFYQRCPNKIICLGHTLLCTSSSVTDPSRSHNLSRSYVLYVMCDVILSRCRTPGDTEYHQHGKAEQREQRIEQNRIVLCLLVPAWLTPRRHLFLAAAAVQASETPLCIHEIQDTAPYRVPHSNPRWFCKLIDTL